MTLISRKNIAWWVAITLAAVLLAAAAGHPVYAADIQVFVNGQEIDYGDSPPMVINERTMVGVRSLALALGVPESGINWDGTSQTVTLAKDDKLITLVLNSTIMVVNGSIVNMDTAPAISNDRIYLPARYVAEALGFAVSWDGPNQRVVIDGNDSSTPSGQDEPTSGPGAWTLDVSGTIQTSPYGTVRDNTLKITAVKQGGENKLGTYTGTISYRQDYIPEGLIGYSYVEYPAQAFTIDLVAYDADTFTNYGLDGNALTSLNPGKTYAAMGYAEINLNGHSSIDVYPADDPSNRVTDESDSTETLKIRMAVYGNEVTVDLILGYDNVTPFMGSISEGAE